MRCWVKSRNERNPRLQLPARLGGHSEGTAGDKPEEGGDDVKSSWPLCPGLHTCYNGGDSGKRGSVPVIGVGGITEAEFADKLVNEGKVDLVAVGRAFWSDSQWAEKAVEKLKISKPLIKP